jgi:hypothetical protein
MWMTGMRRRASVTSRRISLSKREREAMAVRAAYACHVSEENVCERERERLLGDRRCSLAHLHPILVGYRPG